MQLGPLERVYCGPEGPRGRVAPAPSSANGMHMGADTTGAAENNFRVLKHGDSVTTKSSLKHLAMTLTFQEERRFANLRRARQLEFSMQPPRTPGIPEDLLNTPQQTRLRWTTNTAISGQKVTGEQGD